MASSILFGERRVSARRGGMTVLGKVAVPKPINLPSQRLENHGMDPNVEIVPKGSLSWGSRSAATGVSAWGSSPSPSPNTDGSAGSPSFLNGRPSSGGSGTRPSTAGSDKSHEPVSSNAWGPSSRPSSASGVLTSNHSSLASSRPCSAETRPGSSQLSRFAEASADNNVSWQGSLTSEKLGTASSQPKGFNLSSGEFPALGSDKNPELNVRGHSSQGHPASSGAAAPPRERLGMSSTEDGGSMEACTERGTVNTWKRDSPPHQGGPPASTEKWPQDPQQAHPYPNMAMLHHPFDPWHAATPPIRTPPEGDWYGGGVPVGPYGPTGLPGTYPFEPSAYFHSQMAARPLSYPQPVPRPGCGPTGYTKNGESFRPLMSDSYMLPTCPVTPIRPGVYLGPLPFDGYYGPPRMGFCKTDEGDASVMGMTAGSGVHNRYQSQKFHPDSSNYHVRPGVHGSDPEVAKEHESPIGYSTHQGPYKVLLKQHDGRLDKDAEEKRGHSVATSMRGVDHRIGENNWGTDASNDQPMDFSKPAFGEDDTSSQPTGVHGRFSSVSIVGNEPEKTGLANTDSSLKIPETDAIPADHSQQLPDAKKCAHLIDKIEGLNTKARASEVGFASKDEKTKRFKIVNFNADQYTKDTSTTVPPEKLPTGYMPMQSSNRTEAADGDKTSNLKTSDTVESKQLELQVSGENIAGNSEVREKLRSQNQKRGPGCQSRADYRGKGKLNTEETEEWRRKPPGTDSSSVTVLMEGAYTNVRVQDHNATQEGLEMHTGLSNQLGVEPYTISSCNTNNDNAQRERMKKIATQRAKQLQREEEERAKEQKAKALAKLEELNRRTLAGSSTHVKLDQSQQRKPEVTGHFSAPLKTDISSGEMPRRASNIQESFQSLHNSMNLKTLSQPSEKGFNRLEESTDLPVPVEASGHASSCSAVKPAVSPVLMPATGSDLASQVSVSQAFDDGVSRQKLMGHNKRKQNITQEKNLGDEQTTTGGGKIPIDLIVDANSSSDQSSKANSTNDANNTNDTSVALKKKSNRSSKNKNKPDEPLVGTDVPLSASSGETLKKNSVESGKTQVSDPGPEISSLQTRISKEVVEGTYSQVPVSSMDLGLSQPSEEAHDSRVNQLRPQPPRRTSRNTQVIKPAEKFHGSEAVVWAPVQPLSKSMPSEEPSQSTNEGNNNSSLRSFNGVQNNFKSKRAEIEIYVPKPVAKELSQQGNSQQPAPISLPQVISDDLTAGKVDGSQINKSNGQLGSSSGNMGVAVETKNDESKHNNKHGKTQALWRQRGSGEPSHMSHEGALLSPEQSKTNQMTVDPHQPSKLDITSSKRHTQNSENRTHIPAPMEQASGASFTKDHGASEKVRKPTQKVQRGGRHNHTPTVKDFPSGVAEKTEIKTLAFESIESGGRSISRSEAQGSGEHTVSQWQPKSQAYPAHNRQGNRGNDKVMGSQRNAAQVGRASGKDFPSQGMESIPQRADCDSNVLVQQPYRFETQNPSVTESGTPHFQEIRKERRGQEHPSATSAAGHAPANADSHHEQPIPPGIRQHQTGQFYRGPEGHNVGGRGQGQEAIKKQMPGNGDRRKNHSHFEYQPIGFQKSNDSFEHGSVGEEMQGDRGPRHRERGHNHGRHGGSYFNGRNSGAAGRIAVSHGYGE